MEFITIANKCAVFDMSVDSGAVVVDVGTYRAALCRAFGEIYFINSCTGGSLGGLGRKAPRISRATKTNGRFDCVDRRPGFWSFIFGARSFCAEPKSSTANPENSPAKNRIECHKCQKCDNSHSRWVCVRTDITLLCYFAYLAFGVCIAMNGKWEITIKNDDDDREVKRR